MKTVELLHSLNQGIVICNKEGRIIYVNKAYEDLCGKKFEDIFHKKIKDVRVDSYVPQVLKSGKAVEGIYKEDKWQSYFANIYPLIEDECQIGTISIVTTINQSKKQIENANKTLKERVQEFEAQEIRNMMHVYGYTLEAKKLIAKKLDISLSSLYEKINV